MAGMKIGDAAARVGVEAHVLRHWESVGLLDPPRSSSGHRSYDAQTLDEARLIHIFRRAGLSLDRIRELGLADRDARPAIIGVERAGLRRRIELLESTDRFLAHVSECRHPVIAECPECSQFADTHHAVPGREASADGAPTASCDATVVRC